MILKKTLLIIVLISMLFVFACGPKAMVQRTGLDTPENHVANGNKLLKADKIGAALREFTKAKELDPKYSLAYVGLGLVYGFEEDFERAFHNLEYASIFAAGDDQKVAVHIGYMRLNIMKRENAQKKWLEKVKESYKQAIKIAPDLPEPHFFMGVAYKMSFMFNQAVNQFAKVLELDEEYIKETEREYYAIRKIQSAMPLSKVGRKIALLDEITRADIAALFIEELRIDELFAKHATKEFEASNNIHPLTDINDHALKTDIHTIIKYEIEGLKPFPDHTFKPYQMIIRAEYAMMIEDILIKITRDDKLATEFVGKESPFPDLRNDLPYFNAAMICTTRGIMAVKDHKTREFDPYGFITGAESLLSIRTLETQLQK